MVLKKVSNWFVQYLKNEALTVTNLLLVLSHFSRQRVIITELTQLSTCYQLWARYLEGDNISTKIGSSRVEIEIGEASPIFQEIEIGIGEALVKSRVGSGASGFYSRGVETSRDISRSRGKSRLSRISPEISNYPDFFFPLRCPRNIPTLDKKVGIFRVFRDISRRTNWYYPASTLKFELWSTGNWVGSSSWSVLVIFFIVPVLIQKAFKVADFDPRH